MRIQQSEWQDLYQSEEIESLPWYSEHLDGDFELALAAINKPGSRIWDLGCGPGTQAVHLAQAGYQVVGTDLAQDAVAYAKDLAASQQVKVEFLVDDVTSSGVEGSFQIVIDRGCFHTLPPECHADYISAVSDRLETEGYLLLKTFHVDETYEGGPRRYNEESIRAIFGQVFQIVEFKKSSFIGNRIPHPIALFSILKKL